MEIDDVTISMINLMKMLESGDIDGIMLSRMTYYFCMKKIRKYEKYQKLMPQLNITLTEMKLQGTRSLGYWHIPLPSLPQSYLIQ